MKKLFGMGAFVFGGLGLCLSVLGIILIWSLNGLLAERLVTLYDSAEKGLLITGVSLNRMVPQLLWMQDEQGRHLADVPIEEVATTFNELQALLAASVTNTETAVSTIYLFPFYLLLELNEDEWETAVADLDEVTKGLDLLAELSVASKEQDTIPSNLIHIDKQYTQLREQLKTIISKISATRQIVFEIKENIDHWINMFSVVVTFIFLWISMGQLALLMLGWRWFQE